MNEDRFVWRAYIRNLKCWNANNDEEHSTTIRRDLCMIVTVLTLPWPDPQIKSQQQQQQQTVTIQSNPRVAPRSRGIDRHTLSRYQIINTNRVRRKTGRAKRNETTSSNDVFTRVFTRTHARTQAVTHPQPVYQPCQSSRARHHALTALATGSCHSRIARENVAGRSGIANHGETETTGETARKGEGEGEKEKERARRGLARGKEKGVEGGGRETERKKERERRERESEEQAHTRGHCDGGDEWAMLRCGRWRKAIKRFCCGPRFSFLRVRLSLPGFPLLPRRLAFRLSRAGPATLAPRTRSRTETRLFTTTTRGRPPPPGRPIPSRYTSRRQCRDFRTKEGSLRPPI